MDVVLDVHRCVRTGQAPPPPPSSPHQAAISHHCELRNALSKDSLKL